MISSERVIAIFKSAGDEIIRAKDELTAIDAKFGDADHGITMEKIANAFVSSMTGEAPGTPIKTILDDAAGAIMMINGGSAVPLWNTLFDGFAGAVESGMTEIGEADFKRMVKGGLDAVMDLTPARVGDKTMMDALIPGAEAIINSPADDIGEILRAGAEAAGNGAADTARFISKFGRARSYKEATIGTVDAGAASMASFFAGLSKG
ncbi:MAG: DAK2 domain-containing protein [Methylobacteriaceae bacterium]|jgi:dihydroxyacetone kinase-like protein|nr:DAK2 domain-containing protein [Methylobacteriaceae bacterium]